MGFLDILTPKQGQTNAAAIGAMQSAEDDATQKQNWDSAVLNQQGSQYNATNPFGSQTYKIIGYATDGKTPIYGVDQSYNPVQQGLYNQFTGNQATAGSLADTGLYTGVNTGVGSSTFLGNMFNYLPTAQGTASDAAGMIAPSTGMVTSAAGMIPGAFGQAAAASADLNPAIKALFPTIQGQYNTYAGSDPNSVVGGYTSGNAKKMNEEIVAYLNPFFDVQTQKLQNQLANQGFAPGMPGYDNAMHALRTDQGAVMSKASLDAATQAYNQAYQNYMAPLAIAKGGPEIAGNLGQTVSSMVAQGKSQAEIANILSNMGLTQAQIGQVMAQVAQIQGGLAGVGGNLASTGGNLADILTKSGISLTNLGQPAGLDFSKINTPALNIPVAKPTDYIGANQVANNAITGSNKVTSDALSGLFGIAKDAGLGNILSAGVGALGSLLPFSDRRLKENIIEIGKLPNSLNVYSFNYIWDTEPQIGLMADEVEKIHPEAVTEVDGFKRVNYDLAVR